MSARTWRGRLCDASRGAVPLSVLLLVLFCVRVFGAVLLFLAAAAVLVASVLWCV